MPLVVTISFYMLSGPIRGSRAFRMSPMSPLFIIGHMSVGEFAGIALQDASDTWRHGAVFLLQKPARACDPVTLNGWTTSVVGDQRAVITCGQSSAVDSANVLVEALEAANSGLDYLSATGK